MVRVLISYSSLDIHVHLPVIKLSIQIKLSTLTNIIPVYIKQATTVIRSSLVLTNNNNLTTTQFLNIVNNFQGDLDLGLINNTLLNYSKNKNNIIKLNKILTDKYNNIYTLNLSNNKLVYNDIRRIFSNYNGFKSGGIKFSNKFESLNLSNNNNLIKDLNIPNRLIGVFTPSTNKIIINISNSFNTTIKLRDLQRRFSSKTYNLITTSQISTFTNTSSFSFGNYMYLIYALIFLLILYFIFNCAY
jgi:hypothetical protein